MDEENFYTELYNILDDSGIYYEDDAENIWRIFFPLYLNVLIDMIRGKDAFESVTALTRIFGQWKTEGLGFIHDVLTDEEDD